MNIRNKCNQTCDTMVIIYILEYNVILRIVLLVMGFIQFLIKVE